MKFITRFFSAVLLFNALVVDAQQCSNGDFIVTNGQETLLKITAANEVFTCDRVNICDKINQGLQTMSLAADGSTLSISSGNSITLPDSSATNEIQTLSVTSGVLTILGGNSIELPDASATNEIQSLSLSNTGVLSISSSNDVQLPDVSATNELQNLSIEGNTLSISGGNSVQLPNLSLQNATFGTQELWLSDDNTSLVITGGSWVKLPDSSAENELQSLQLFGSTLWITNGNSVQLPDVSATNELQTLALTGTTLSISSGNSIQLPDVSATNEIQTLSLASGKLSISSGNIADLTGLKTYLKFLGFSASIPTGTAKASGETLLPFSVTDWITFPDTSFSNVTGVFTAPLAGYYRLSIHAYSITASTAADRASFYWKVNGIARYHGICGGQFSAGDSPFPACNYIIKLNVNDVVRAYMYSSIAMTLGTNPGTECQWQTEFLGP